MAQQEWTAKQKEDWVNAQRKKITNPIARMWFEKMLTDDGVLEEISQQYQEEASAKEQEKRKCEKEKIKNKEHRSNTCKKGEKKENMKEKRVRLVKIN